MTIGWGTSNFVNPPYGRNLPTWVRKAHEQANLGKTVVLLVPARTDTAWWHDHVMCADEIRYLKGRLTFPPATNSAPFPSAIAIWRGKQQ